MAQDVIINGVTYENVPEVDIPKSGGGTALFIDTADGDITSADVLSGKIGYNSSGKVTGSMPNNGASGGTISTPAGTVVIPAGYTSGGTVSLGDVTDCVAGNILTGKSILGVSGSLNVPTVSQDGVTKILSIS